MAMLGHIPVIPPRISVVICAYTEARWDDLVAAVRSVQQQQSPACETIVVVDHNPTLLNRVCAEIEGVIAIENDQHKGLAGARNSGAAIAKGAVVAFLDDDAVAEPAWLAHLAACYADPNVVGVGGRIEPQWHATRPVWFPPEFHWVVGCTYRGMPVKRAAVRNVLGANMSVRREVLLNVGGFAASFGRTQDHRDQYARRRGLQWLHQHAGEDEETELCIRVSQRRPESVWLYTPQAVVRHRVPQRRTSWQYFVGRCYDEGLGKALLARVRGARAGLAAERSYTLTTLPRGILRELTASARGEMSALGRAAAIAGGFAATATGYLVGSCAVRLAPVREEHLAGRGWHADG
jgi:cellulose synthase/poly-beta-1,6-N-acetylglucosamine synthase-like glycosyltransferase